MFGFYFYKNNRKNIDSISFILELYETCVTKKVKK